MAAAPRRELTHSGGFPMTPNRSLKLLASAAIDTCRVARNVLRAPLLVAGLGLSLAACASSPASLPAHAASLSSLGRSSHAPAMELGSLQGGRIALSDFRGS